MDSGGRAQDRYPRPNPVGGNGIVLRAGVRPDLDPADRRASRHHQAAVYYHFPAKEDLVVSLADDLRAGVDDILAWAAAANLSARGGPGDPAALRAAMHETGREMTRFMYENQATFRRLGVGAALRYQFRQVADAITAPSRDPLAIFHARQALAAISWSVGMMGDVDLTDEQCRDAAVNIALKSMTHGQSPKPMLAATFRPDSKPVACLVTAFASYAPQ